MNNCSELPYRLLLYCFVVLALMGCRTTSQSSTKYVAVTQRQEMTIPRRPSFGRAVMDVFAPVTARAVYMKLFPMK